MSKFFYVKLVRFFYDQNGVCELGPLSAHLVVQVGLEQDRRRGMAVSWPNAIAMERLSVSSKQAFFDARRRAVDSGWLEYTNRGQHLAGQYRMVKPKRFANEGDENGGQQSEPPQVPDSGPGREPKRVPEPSPLSTDVPKNPGAGSKVSPPPTTLTPRERLRQCLARLVVPVYNDACLDEWIGLVTEIGGCQDAEEGLAALRWIVRIARKEGHSVERARDLIDVAKRWRAFRSRSGTPVHPGQQPSTQPGQPLPPDEGSGTPTVT